MWNVPSKERLSKIPKLYETEHIALKEKLIYLHFFIGGCDWYIAEYDGEDLFWGFAVLNEDLQNAEWGYISFGELKSVKVNGWLEIDCETEEVWQTREASEIEKIRIAHGWPENDGSLNKSSKEEKLITKIKAGHFQSFQDLFSEVTSPYSDFFGVDPYPLWQKARERRDETL
jgi:hypothetical protein